MNNKIVEKLNEYDVVLNRAGRYGASVRSIITEEMGELIQAISKMERSSLRLNDLHIQRHNTFNEEDRMEITTKIEEVKGLRETEFEPNLSEEIADVIIALYWIFKRYKVEENDVIDWLEEKCNRMDTRLEEGDFY